MNNQLLFISGMFRSGTTLLARMLNVHSNIACASDPIRPLFNSFRYTIANESYKSNHQRYDPLGDYFMEDVDILQTILNSDLNVKIEESKEDLWNIIQASAKPFSGLWAETLKKNQFLKTYRDFILNALDHINFAYGKGKNTEIIAFKETWLNEMIPAFLNTFPHSKAIIVIRDPRAVTSSNNITSAKYPVFFTGRQWRKLAYLGDYIKRKYSERVLIIQYEDLIKDVQSKVQEICGFLNIDFEDNLINPSQYLDGNNQPWKQNSSYAHGNKQKFELKSLDKWKNVLEPSDTLLLELICWDWMKHFNYQHINNSKLILSQPKTVWRRFAQEDLSQWIRPYSFDQNESQFQTEIIKEKLRLGYVINHCPLSSEMYLNLQIKE